MKIQLERFIIAASLIIMMISSAHPSKASIVINTPVALLRAQEQLKKTQEALERSFEQLSNELKSLKESDDAAGLGVSEKMKSQIRDLEIARKTITDALNLAETTATKYDEMTALLINMQKLSDASSDQIFQQSRKKIESIAKSVDGNKKNFSRGKLSLPFSLLQKRVRQISNDIARIPKKTTPTERDLKIDGYRELMEKTKDGIDTLLLSINEQTKKSFPILNGDPDRN